MCVLSLCLSLSASVLLLLMLAGSRLVIMMMQAMWCECSSPESHSMDSSTAKLDLNPVAVSCLLSSLTTATRHKSFSSLPSSKCPPKDQGWDRCTFTVTQCEENGTRYLKTQVLPFPPVRFDSKWHDPRWVRPKHEHSHLCASAMSNIINAKFVFLEMRQCFSPSDCTTASPFAPFSPLVSLLQVSLTCLLSSELRSTRVN